MKVGCELVYSSLKIVKIEKQNTMAGFLLVSFSTKPFSGVDSPKKGRPVWSPRKSPTCVETACLASTLLTCP